MMQSTWKNLTLFIYQKFELKDCNHYDAIIHIVLIVFALDLTIVCLNGTVFMIKSTNLTLFLFIKNLN